MEEVDTIKPSSFNRPFTFASSTDLRLFALMLKQGALNRPFEDSLNFFMGLTLVHSHPDLRKVHFWGKDCSTCVGVNEVHFAFVVVIVIVPLEVSY